MQLRLLIRLLYRNIEIYSLKILTLAVAFAALIMVSVFALHEFRYDRFHKNSSQIIRLIEKQETETLGRNKFSSQIPQQVYDQFTTVEQSTFARVKVLNELRINTPTGTHHQQLMHAADAEITDIFTFRFIHGGVQEFQRNPSCILLSTALSKQYFGTTDAVGKELAITTFGDTLKLTVAAVYESFPSNSHQNFESFIRLYKNSLRTLGFDLSTSEVYALNTGKKSIERKIVNGASYSQQNISDIYFGPRMSGEDVVHGDPYSVTILSCITALILFLALTSFINLTSLALPNRVKELAIKKLAGHSKLQLVLSFIRESFLISLMAFLVAVLILWLSWNYLEEAQVINLPELIIQELFFLVCIILIFLLLLVTAPLLMIGKFIKANAIRLLSSEAITFPRFKKVIIIVQLGISIFLIVSAIVINRQVAYSLVKEPGRNNYQVVYVNYPDGMTNEQLNSLRAGWKKSRPNIVNVMAVSQLPNQINSRDIHTGVYTISVDSEFNNFFDLEIISGGWFGPNDGDSMMVVNQSAFNQLKGKSANIRGVYRDISGKFNLPEKPIQMVRSGNVSHNFLCIRILEVDILKTIGFLENYFSSKGQLTNVQFMNKRFEAWINYQMGLNSLTNVLTIIAALLSCCAIYGLSISVVKDKLKQIAIRKICGADLLHITYLLAKEFVINLFIAVLIFAPITYIVIQELLRAFVYSTELNWLDPVYPLIYCGVVIGSLCAWQALNLNRSDLSAALKE